MWMEDYVSGMTAKIQANVPQISAGTWVIVTQVIVDFLSHSKEMPG
jgi:hypothetical protein